MAAKHAVDKSISRKILQASLIGGGADASISAGFSLADQAERVDVGMQDSINYNQVFSSAALGAVSGFGFNAATMGAGRLKPVRAVTESEIIKKGDRSDKNYFNEGGSYYSHPTITDIRLFKKKGLKIV